MIDKLIEKYKEKSKHYHNMILDATDTEERFLQNEKYHINYEFIQDLEDLKKNLNSITEQLCDFINLMPKNHKPNFKLANKFLQILGELIGVDTDE